ncbi:MAG: LuxR C-terminal-related transcriptional regulator [Acetobacteraceae bacterium]|jgi:DNA-binding CsgD family transcriptional regulator
MPERTANPEDTLVSPVASAAGSAPSVLTPREQQIAEAIKRGLSNKMIARNLNMAEATVKVHVRSILNKLGVVTRSQAAVQLMRELHADAPDAPSAETDIERWQELAENDSEVLQFDAILGRLEVGIAHEKDAMNALLSRLRTTLSVS